MGTKHNKQRVRFPIGPRKANANVHFQPLTWQFANGSSGVEMKTTVYIFGTLLFIIRRSLRSPLGT